jgi:hypothetical protein
MIKLHFVFLLFIFGIHLVGVSLVSWGETQETSSLETSPQVPVEKMSAETSKKSERPRGPQRPFDMEWEEIEGATQYEIEVLSEQGQILIQKITPKASWSGQIRPGRYQYRLRAFDKRKVPGPWSELEPFTVFLSPVTLLKPEKNKPVLQALKQEEEEVFFSWSLESLATDYKLFIQNEKTSELKEILVAKNPSYKIQLPVAHRYHWWVLPINREKNSEGLLEECEKGEFVLMGPALTKVTIETPETDFVRKILWSHDSHSKKFEVKFLRKVSEKSWEVVSKTESPTGQVDVDLSWPGGRYQVQVKAQADHRRDSELSMINFNLRNGDRSEQAQYKAEMRAAIDGFVGWYGQASYLITEIQYTSRQIDLGIYANTEFNTISGTGRLGFGYLGAKKEWGFLSILDLSGMINVQGHNVTFASGELVGLYRTELMDRDELRFKIGAYFKQLPFANVDVFSSLVTQYSHVHLYGATLGLEYWYSLSPKLGFQTHAYFYSSLSGQDSLGKQPAKGDSYQYGFLGSYRLSQNRTGLMGLAYRQDATFFQGVDSLGKPVGEQLVNIRGLFLNLLLEHRF